MKKSYRIQGHLKQQTYIWSSIIGIRRKFYFISLIFFLAVSLNMFTFQISIIKFVLSIPVKLITGEANRICGFLH